MISMMMSRLSLLMSMLMSLMLMMVCTGQKFDPYVDNGGTVVGMCGHSFTIIAADTRLSDGVINTSIQSIHYDNTDVIRMQEWRSNQEGYQGYSRSMRVLSLLDQDAGQIYKH